MKKISAISMNVLAILIALLFIIPGLWLISSAFKPGNELFDYPLTLLPKSPTIDNFVNAWVNTDFLKYTLNTLFVTVTATILTVFLSTTCGYALAKYKYKWLDYVFLMLLSTTMLPTEVMMAPSFEVIYRLGLYNSLSGIIIPTLSTLTGVFMLRQFFVTVPDALLEAARIDGASEPAIFVRIMVPLAMPVIAILTIFSFRWRWNDYIWPLIVIDDPDKYTLQLALRNLVGEMAIDWTTLLASSVLSMLPIIIIFLVFQKYIMNGNLSSGIK